MFHRHELTQAKHEGQEKNVAKYIDYASKVNDCQHKGSNSTWLDSTRLDTFDVSSPCILAVSS